MERVKSSSNVENLRDRWCFNFHEVVFCTLHFFCKLLRVNSVWHIWILALPDLMYLRWPLVWYFCYNQEKWFKNSFTNWCIKLCYIAYKFLHWAILLFLFVCFLISNIDSFWDLKQNSFFLQVKFLQIQSGISQFRFWLICLLFALLIVLRLFCRCIL